MPEAVVTSFALMQTKTASLASAGEVFIGLYYEASQVSWSFPAYMCVQLLVKSLSFAACVCLIAMIIWVAILDVLDG